MKAEAIADAQDIPHKFLESILNDMRRGGLVLSQRGGNGGYRLAKPAESIRIADVIRVVDGPLVCAKEFTNPLEKLASTNIARHVQMSTITRRARPASMGSER